MPRLTLRAECPFCHNVLSPHDYELSTYHGAPHIHATFRCDHCVTPQRPDFDSMSFERGYLAPVRMVTEPMTFEVYWYPGDHEARQVTVNCNVSVSRMLVSDNYEEYASRRPTRRVVSRAELREQAQRLGEVGWTSGADVPMFPPPVKRVQTCFVWGDDRYDDRKQEARNRVLFACFSHTR